MPSEFRGQASQGRPPPEAALRSDAKDAQLSPDTDVVPALACKCAY